MPFRLFRRLTALVAACGVIAVAWLPQEHMHLDRTADGHRTAIIHQHYEPHHPLETEVGHDDSADRIEWLSSSFTPPKPTVSVHPIQPLLDVPVPEPRLRPVRQWTQGPPQVFIDDPPGTSTLGLRAPPSSFI